MKRCRVVPLFVAVLALSAVAATPSSSSAAPARSALAGLSDHRCARAVARTASPVGTTGCGAVRPGALVEVPSVDAFCTLGFVHKDGKGRWYITTAGHCAFPERVDSAVQEWSPGAGPVAYSGSGKPIGRFVFAGLSAALDVGVILLSKGITPKAQVCHFGGPTGVATSRTRKTIPIEFYGNADGASLVLPARSGVAMGMRDEKRVYALSPSWFGDSGGPVMTSSDGRAIGHTVAIGVAAGIGTDPWAGAIFVARIGPQMTQAQKYLGYKLYLKTASRL